MFKILHIPTANYVVHLPGGFDIEFNTIEGATRYVTLNDGYFYMTALDRPALTYLSYYSDFVNRYMIPKHELTIVEIENESI